MTRRWFALGVLTLAVLLIGVDGTVLALATPFIGQDLGASFTQILWIGDIYSFVLAGLLISMGSLGDRIGHKKLLLCGATAFALVSVVTAYSSSAEMLILTRALLGVAGATLTPATLALIRGLFPDSEGAQHRRRHLGVCILRGRGLRPCSRRHSARALLVGLGVPDQRSGDGGVGRRRHRPSARTPQPRAGPVGPAQRRPVDDGHARGRLRDQGRHRGASSHDLRADVVAAGVIGAAALILFVRRQLRLPTPLIDVRLFGNRAFSGVVAANLLSVLGLSGLVFFLSQFFQLVHGYGPLKAGLAELPAAVTATVFGVLAGVAVRYWSPRAVLTAGLALVGVAMASLTLITPSTPYLPLGVALFLVGVGLGLAFTVASDVILASVPKERAGAAAAVSETAYELGMALGIATLGSIVTGVYRNFVVPPGIPAAVAADARDSLAAATQAATQLPPSQGEALLEAAKAAFTSGLAIASGVGSVLMLISAVAVWLLLRQRLPGAAEIAVLDDPGVHRDTGGDGSVDAACGAELGDRHG